MSRVGKHPISIPSGVNVSLDGRVLSVKLKEFFNSYVVPECVNIDLSADSVTFKPLDESKQSIALWGTSRSIVASMIRGMVQPFTKKMDLVGVGYKASVQGQNLVLQLGYSHDIIFPIPEDVKIVCEKPTLIAVSSHNSQKVGQAVKEIQGFRKPEPYKGKGVIISGQFVYRKEGKKK